MFLNNYQLACDLLVMEHQCKWSDDSISDGWAQLSERENELNQLASEYEFMIDNLPSR